jgi:hypothetical protein
MGDLLLPQSAYTADRHLGSQVYGGYPPKIFERNTSAAHISSHVLQDKRIYKREYPGMNEDQASDFNRAPIRSLTDSVWILFPNFNYLMGGL